MTYRKGLKKTYSQRRARQGSLLKPKPSLETRVNAKVQELSKTVRALAPGYDPSKPLNRQDSAVKAKLIRKELATAFPGVPFRVKTDRFSGGSSVDVFWTDGPASEKVESIAGRYERLDRDPSTGEILSGGNSYVQCHRTISEEVKKKETDAARNRVVNFEKVPDWDPQLMGYVWEKVNKTDYPPKPPPTW